MRLRARLFAVRHGRAGRAGPRRRRRRSRTTSPGRSAFYTACGYLPARPACRPRSTGSSARPRSTSRLSRTGPFVPPQELAAVLGCRPAELPAVLSAIGYVERDGRFERRRRAGRERVAGAA